MFQNFRISTNMLSSSFGSDSYFSLFLRSSNYWFKNDHRSYAWINVATKCVTDWWLSSLFTLISSCDAKSSWGSVTMHDLRGSLSFCILSGFIPFSLYFLCSDATFTISLNLFFFFLFNLLLEDYHWYCCLKSYLQLYFHTVY